MARVAEKTEIMTLAERKAFAKRLRDAAAIIEDHSDLVGDGDAWVFRKPSLIDGMRRIDAFTVDLRKTINQIIAGKPLKKNSTKADLAG